MGGRRRQNSRAAKQENPPVGVKVSRGLSSANRRHTPTGSTRPHCALFGLYAQTDLLSCAGSWQLHNSWGDEGLAKTSAALATSTSPAANNQFSHVAFKSFDWSYLGFGLCRLWIVQWKVLPLVAFAFKGIGGDFLFFLPAALACFFAATLIPAGNHPRARTLLFISSVVATFAGIALFTLGSITNASITLPLGLVFMGIGAALLQTLWGDKYASIDSKHADLYTVCSMLVASLLQTCMTIIDSTSAAMVLFFLVPLGSYILLLRGFSAGRWQTEVNESSESDIDHEPISEPAKSVHDSVNSTSNQLGLGRLCLSIAAFVFVYNLASSLLFGVSRVDTEEFTFDGVIRTVASVFVLVLLLALFLKRGNIKLLTLYRAAFLMLIGALVVWLVDPLATRFVAIVAAMGYKLFDVLFWCLLVRHAHEHRSSAWRVLGFGMVANMIAMGLALGARWFLSVLPFAIDIDSTVLCALLVVVLAAIAMLLLPESLVQRFTDRDSKTLKKKAAEGEAASLEDRVSEVAQSHGLTSREEEVLRFLAQGRTQAVIAEKLHISVGTAHSHIVHVYQKTGVHSQQELIDLVERA